YFADHDERLSMLRSGNGDGIARMRREVAVGLGAPGLASLPPKFLYDAAGSELYERITGLPEYYPTRTEARLLEAIAPALRRLVRPREIVELGSGSSSKTRTILDALAAGPRQATYVAIDVSEAALADATCRLVKDYPGLRVLGLVGEFEDALAMLLPAPGRLAIFLGGTLGNLTAEQQELFFARVAASLGPDGHLLIGFDRRAHAGKPAERIRVAYDDAEGVTAAFNLNVLRHLNTALGMDFDPTAWVHEAIYDEHLHQIEMRLVSLRDQVVHLPGYPDPLKFPAGRRILTEISRKFAPEELAAWLGRRGFTPVRSWTDDQAMFGLMLLQRRV
ncbi:MAG: dimethylhistidine N-methyltransferase, partial [Cyanobacteria bacterium RYN_339]|nr:dimethylhistidine N-methyltransferase [Cyanobacteria bacterium RYN_339]